MDRHCGKSLVHKETSINSKQHTTMMACLIRAICLYSNAMSFAAAMTAVRTKWA